MNSVSLTRRASAEALGTFLLVLFGCGAIVVSAHTGAFGHAGIAAAFGLAVMCLIYAFGDISGAHFNPAVTWAFYLARVLPGRDLLPYVFAQSGGAVVAGLLLKVMYPEADAGMTRVSVGIPAGFITEVLLSFMLMLVILHVSQGARERGLMAGVAIGGCVGLDALVGGPLTGASMNPARSLGPALASGDVTLLWLYFCAPVLGTSIAVWLCRWLFQENCCSACD